ncbi:MAG: hypothetical protein CBB97_17310 [Candidatus Endolissoclinum sp. TMED37]|nr:MAG: hypothetical protein CBB97_17310 [Candidatus Endolissoclinum sp. TMED37]
MRNARLGFHAQDSKLVVMAAETRIGRCGAAEWWALAPKALRPPRARAAGTCIAKPDQRLATSANRWP